MQTKNYICILELQTLKCLENACESKSRYNSRVFLSQHIGGQSASIQPQLSVTEFSHPPTLDFMSLCVPYLIPDKGRVSLMLDLPSPNLG